MSASGDVDEGEPVRETQEYLDQLKVIDGFIEKRSKRKHTWARRYVRTARYSLLYFSYGLAKIEAARVRGGGSPASPYHHRTSGVAPAEDIDLRSVDPLAIQRVHARSGRPFSEEEFRDECARAEREPLPPPPLEPASWGVRGPKAQFRISYVPPGAARAGRAEERVTFRAAHWLEVRRDCCRATTALNASRESYSRLQYAGKQRVSILSHRSFSPGQRSRLEVV
jgi:hypothetical protein